MSFRLGKRQLLASVVVVRVVIARVVTDRSANSRTEADLRGV
jgi:hypothetical protein